MELAKYKACICEGAAENAIMDILLDETTPIPCSDQTAVLQMHLPSRTSEACHIFQKHPALKKNDFGKAGY